MFKRIVLFIGIACLVPGLCHASGYLIGTYGFGGAMDDPSWGAELGGVFLSDMHPTGGSLSAGIGFSVGETKDDVPSSHPTPKKYDDGNEYEGYINLGAEFIPGLFGTAGLGYATQKVVTVDRAGEIDSKTEKRVTGMIGLRYLIQGFSAGIGFHTRRGIVVNAGLAF
jgi:hypothetical protein